MPGHYPSPVEELRLGTEMYKLLTPIKHLETEHHTLTLHHTLMFLLYPYKICYDSSKSLISKMLKVTPRSSLQHEYSQRWNGHHGGQDLQGHFFHGQFVNFNVFQISDLENVEIHTKIKSVCRVYTCIVLICI